MHKLLLFVFTQPDFTPKPDSTFVDISSVLRVVKEKTDFVHFYRLQNQLRICVFVYHVNTLISSTFSSGSNPGDKLCCKLFPTISVPFTKPEQLNIIFPTINNVLLQNLNNKIYISARNATTAQRFKQLILRLFVALVKSSEPR